MGDYYVGGLVGDFYAGTITNSYSSGSVTGYQYVGGLVGRNYGTITNSYSSGSVSGSFSVGGLAGSNGGTITFSYSSGTVSGSYYVGGLAGSNGGPITYSYSTGSVSGNMYVGGLVGSSSYGAIINSYWDIYRSGRSNCVGSNEGPIICTGKNSGNSEPDYWYYSTHAPMDLWNFDTIWGIGVTYPYLRWQFPDVNYCTCGDICVNERGWWRDKSKFNPSNTPIQHAIEHATTGDTICVKDGTYNENVDVTKSDLTIRSENGPSVTTVSASLYLDDHVFDITDQTDVTLEGFEIRDAHGTSQSVAGIYMNNACECKISDNIVTDISATNGNTALGILLYSSSNNNNLSGNTAYNNTGDGIRLSSSSNNNLSGNTAYDNNDNGIYLGSSSNNNLSDNFAYNNTLSGISLASSSNNNKLSENTAYENNDNGIYLGSSSSNNFSGNTAHHNFHDGIQLYSSSNNNFSDNNAYDNSRNGICLHSSSSNNLIYNNYFNNTNNAWDNGINIWNITKTLGTNIIGGQYLGGNYWSDYAGRDINGDGLGDTLLPYNSNGNITIGGDYHPLVPVGFAPLLSINKTSNPDPVLAGGTLNYSIHVNNTGNATATNVTVKETYDGNVTFVTAVPAPSSGNDTWKFATLNASERRWINISVTVNASVLNGTVLHNIVNVTCDEGVSDFDTEDTTVFVAPVLNCTCGDICVNTSGWWRDGGVFNPSLEPIWAAVNSSAVGETICVKDGAYNENVDVDKRLTIRSENGSASTIVNALDSNDHVFKVTANWVNISGFTVQNATENNKAGIYLGNGVEHCTIFDNKATNNYFGICLWSSDNNNFFADNTASDNNNYDFYSHEDAYNNTVEDLTIASIASYPTTISFTYANGVGLKGVEIALSNLTGKANIGKFVNAMNVTADSWIFLNVNYSDADLDGVDEDSLRMWRYNGTDWTEVPAPNGVNTIENYVYANITSFSIFAPLGNVTGVKLEINKTGAPDPVPAGGTLNYTISVNNTGNATATNVTVKETYDENVTFVTAVPAPSQGNDTWVFATLNVNETRWVNISVTVNASAPNGTVLHNIVNVTCDEGVSDFDTEDTTVLSALAPVLEINKTDNPDTVLAGGTLNYSISVNNTGNATATNVTVMETYDGNVTFVTAVPAPSQGNDMWKFATLNVSEMRWINISVIVNASAPNGTVLHNVVNVTCDEGVMDSDTEDTTVLSAAAPVLEINKTSNPDPVPAGGTLNYSISVNNTGNATATNVTVKEAYDENVTFVTAVPAPSQGNDTWKFTSLNVSETRWINISVTVNMSVPNGTVLHNVVNVTCDEGVMDSDTEDTTVLSAAVPVLEINKTDAPDPVLAGGTLNYSISVNNTGNATATNVTVKETYDWNVTFVTAVPAPSLGNDTWIFATLNVSETRWINISVSVNASVLNGTVLHNIVNVTCDEGVMDSNTEDTTVLSAVAPVLEINKTGVPDPVSPGGTLNYSISVNNTGNATAINVTVKETYDGNVTFVTAVPAPSLGNDTWKFATLNVNETKWVNISVTVNASAPNGAVLHNIVNVTCDEGVSDSDTENTTVLVAPVPALEINKTGVPDPVSPGGTLNYSIHVNNTGNATATNVTVTETYDGNVTFVSAVPAPSQGNDTWQFATLNVSETRWINISVIVNASVPNGTVVHNVVNVTCDEGVSDTDTEDTTVLSAAAPVLEINKTCVPDPVPAGGTLNYSIRVNNTGNATATNVTVKETYDGNVTFVSAVPAPSQGNDTWKFATLNASETRWINISVIVNASAPNGTVLHNFVNVTCDEGVSDSDTEDTTVLSTVAPVLEINKTSNLDPVPAGGTLNYSISVNNTGNATATNVTVKETYDGNVTFVMAVPAPSQGNDTWQFATLNASETRWVNISVSVNASAPNGTVLHNFVNVTCDEGVTDSDTENTTVFVAPVPVLEIAKADAPDPVSPGGTLNYTISVNNTGNATATNVTVMETYDKNVTFVAAVPAPSQGNDTWKFATLNVSETRWINISVIVNASVLNGTVLHNIVNVTCDEGVMDSDTENTTVFVAPVPVLEITKADAPDPVSPGGTLNYTISVNNTGNATATNVTVMETYDKNVTFVAAVPAPSQGNDTWEFATLNVSETRWINISVIVNASVLNGTVLHNIVNVTCAEGVSDTDTENTTVFVAPVPVREITKTDAPDPVSPGGALNYSIHVNNTGNATATNVTVMETYDGNVTFVTAVPAPSLGNDTWEFAMLNASETKWINISVIVNASVLNGTMLHNYVNVTCDEGVTDSDTENTTVFVAPVPALEINKTSNPDPVPAGGTLNYSISVNNTGNATATNVTVKETYDGNVTFVTAVPAPSQGNDTWEFATLNASETRWINVSVIVNASVLNGTVLHNIVNVTCDEGVTDTDTADTTVLFKELNCTCGDICVNETGWWHNGGAFNPSNTPIQHAVDNATAGDTICVKDGTYHENVDVTKSHLTIRSANGPSVTTVSASLYHNKHVFNITDQTDVTVEGFEIRDAHGTNQDVAGIYMNNASECNISGNIVTNISATDGNAANGIYLWSSSDNSFDTSTVYNLDADDQAFGISLWDSSNNNSFDTSTVYNLSANDQAYGILLYSSSDNSFSSSTTVYNLSADEYAYGIYLCYSSDNSFDTSTVYDLYSNDGFAYGIYLYYLSNNNRFSSSTSVYNLSANDKAYGILLDSSSDNSFDTSTVYNLSTNYNAYGIFLLSSSDNTFSSGSISDIKAPTWWDFYSEEDAHGNSAENITISSFPTTISFTYDNGIKLKSVATPPADPAYRQNISKYVNVTEVSADSWIFMNVSYEEGDLGGVDENTLRLWKHNGTDWTEVPGTNGVNTAENYVYANITEFSVFAPLGNVTGVKLEINKTGVPDPVSPGGTLNYTISVNNTGNATATNVTVTETYDGNVTFVTAVPAPSSGNDTWQFATLNVSERRWINISVSVNASVPNGTVLHNVVNVTCDEGVTDSDTEDTTVLFKELNCTCGDICVNTTGWWRDGGAFNASNTPIQDAIDNAIAGETICVKDGTYNENVDVNVNNLIIKSENGSANCIVNASNPGDYVFEVTGNYVNISGFTIEGATGAGGSYSAGIYLDDNVHNCMIYHNTIVNNNYGIWLHKSNHNNTLTNNNVSANTLTGISLARSCTKNRLTNNIASSNQNDDIMLAHSSNYNMLTNNTANSNDRGIVLSDSHNNTLANNTANSNTHWNGIILTNSNDNVLEWNTCLDNTHGIKLDKSNRNILEQNNCSNNYHGFEIQSSRYNTIRNNIANENSEHGMYIFRYWATDPRSNFNTLINNNVSNNTKDGIKLDNQAQYNNLTDNNVSLNKNDGISLGGSCNHNNLAGNTVTGNSRYGIWMESAHYNNLTRNTVNANTGRGIYMRGPSNNNTLYNNYFNNTNNAYDEGHNTWNITKEAGTNIFGGPYLGGNYWSDYAGIDTNGDGLGNTLLPYNASGKITTGGDWHPLTTVGYAPPEIISFAPPSPVNDTVCTWRTFNITVNQTVNVSWYLNNTLQHTNVSTKEASYTLHAEIVGEHNVSAIASNENGTDMQSWVWNVTATPLPVLGINKTGVPDPVSPAEALNYTIRVNNTGNATATNVIVKETYDANVTFIAAEPAPSSGEDTWQFATLNASETIWINISVTVKASVPNGTVLHNIVNVSCDEGVTDTDTEDTTVFVAPALPPKITSFAPPSPVNDTVCNWRTFNVTVDQTVNVSWYLNNTLQQTNVSTKEASYTLHAEVVGEHNVSAIASNENGTDMQSWIWNVTVAPEPVLEINKTGVPDPVSPAGALNYTIRVNNTGNATATNVKWKGSIHRSPFHLTNKGSIHRKVF